MSSAGVARSSERVEDQIQVTVGKPSVIARRLIGSLISCLAGVLALSATFTAASSEPIRVSHAQGETTLPGVPQKVLTFDLASLETLDAVGVTVAGVPRTHIPKHLSKYTGDTYLKIGTLFEPDYEAVNAAKPDLIIVGARTATKYAELSKIAPTIDLSVSDEHFVDSAVRNARTLGQIFRKQAEIDALAAGIETSAAKLRTASANAGTGLIILTTGGRMSAYGPTSRFGALHRDFGIRPAVETLDAAIHGQGVSFELILKANPDWLFVVDRDAAVGQSGQPAAQLLDNPLVTRTTAWKKHHVVYLEPVRWYLVGGGLPSLQASIDQIATALQAAP
ncbi:MAG TPA: siderophore ABC transporter substrate-binding protein [Hyphomicrobium sp.]|nr:siderophore ABC transporter substrate-binding protein [Hyphomicrobium sp.]